LFALVDILQENRNIHRALVGVMKECDHFEDLGVDGKIILKWLLKELD